MHACVCAQMSGGLGTPISGQRPPPARGSFIMSRLALWPPVHSAWGTYPWTCLPFSPGPGHTRTQCCHLGWPAAGVRAAPAGTFLLGQLQFPCCSPHVFMELKIISFHSFGPWGFLFYPVWSRLKSQTRQAVLRSEMVRGGKGPTEYPFLFIFLPW